MMNSPNRTVVLFVCKAVRPQNSRYIYVVELLAYGNEGAVVATFGGRLGQKTILSSLARCRYEDKLSKRGHETKPIDGFACRGSQVGLFLQLCSPVPAN